MIPVFDSPRELLAKIRLGEDSLLELKEVTFREKKLASPLRNDLADELAAFANARGGTLVLGVEDETREVIGIAEDRLDSVESYVREILNDSVRPPLDAVVIKMRLPDSTGEARAVVRIDVPQSLFVHQSPGGYLRRIGSSKRPIPPPMLERLFQQRSQGRLIRFDEQSVPGVRWDDLAPELWGRFVSEAEEPRTTLRKLRILTEPEGEDGVSVSGVLMCSTEPERWLPGARIEAVRYRGDERDSNYQLDADSITGPVDEQIRRAVAFVDRTMRRSASKRPERVETPQFSLRAVFEAVVNAVAHRDYSIHGSKIRLFVFDDRLELFSPGGLPNSLTVDSLPLRQSTRNELLTTLLGRLTVRYRGGYDLRRSYFIEKRGEGVPIILREGKALAGREPEYKLIDESELLLTIWAASEVGLDRG